MSDVNHSLANRLAQHGLRSTEIRRMVLRVFDDIGNRAIDKTEIEKFLPDIDRITLYRTLRSFEESGLIHQVHDGSARTKYASYSEQHTHGDEDHDHAHFKCNKCNKTLCLPGQLSGMPNLPAGFEIDKYHLIVEGTCDNCD